MSLSNELNELQGDLVKIQQRTLRLIEPQLSHNETARAFVLGVAEDLDKAGLNVQRALSALGMTDGE